MPGPYTAGLTGPVLAGRDRIPGGAANLWPELYVLAVRMKRKAYIIGVVALGLTAMAARTTPLYGKFATSARTFQRYVNRLNTTGDSLSPIERFVFSLILANGDSPHNRTSGTAPQPHT